MKTFNRKPLFLALAGMTAFGAVSTAQAVSVTPTGLGSVLLNPYYTVKGDTNPYNTLLSIVNTTASTKAVKIRFREGKASSEVLDFNIFLSPYDVWTASLEPSASGGVRLFTTDNSCTIPPIPAAGVEFRNSVYQGDAAKDNSLTRLREGYFEVIEMSTYTDGSTVAINSTHQANRIPKDCTKVTDTVAGNEQRPPQGGMMGTASIVSPGTGLNAAVDPTVLINFRSGPLYRDTGSVQPNLADADPWSLTDEGDGNVIYALWNEGIDAVSAAIMKNAIMNEFVLDVGTQSATDWVITFPTKGFYVAANGSGHSNPFQSNLTSTGSCDDIILTTWDREEQTKQPGGPDFSPAPPPDKVQLCWEANILTFNSHNIFNSSNTLGVSTLFINGWARIDFHFDNPLPLIAFDSVLFDANQDGNAFTTFGGLTFTGLPVIGFAVQTFRPSLVSSYAGVFPHRFVPGTPNNFNFNPVAR